MITLIAAVSLNSVIGDGDIIPWRLPEDMKHFRKTTMGSTVVMGRKTFESMKSQPLKGRHNIVLSAKLDPYRPVDIEVLKDLPTDTLLSFCSSLNTLLEEIKQDVFIIGGTEIYNATMWRADRLIISHVLIPVKGDKLFPYIDLNQFKVSNVEEHLDATLPFKIITYDRIKQDDS